MPKAQHGLLVRPEDTNPGTQSVPLLLRNGTTGWQRHSAPHLISSFLLLLPTPCLLCVRLSMWPKEVKPQTVLREEVSLWEPWCGHGSEGCPRRPLCACGTRDGVRRSRRDSERRAEPSAAGTSHEWTVGSWDCPSERS